MVTLVSPLRAASAAIISSQLIEAFKEGQVAEPLATIYLTRNDASPMANWSYFNQLSVLLSGCTDARGYRQWQQIGRHVRRGQKARAFILIPLIAKDKEDEEHRFLYGFKIQPVFDVTQTEGEPLPSHPHRDFLDTLPLVEVSRTWGIRADTYSGEGHRYRGLWRKSGTEEGILPGGGQPRHVAARIDARRRPQAGQPQRARPTLAQRNRGPVGRVRAGPPHRPGG